MNIAAAPIRQMNHRHIDNAIEQWLDIHYGDTSFNGRVVIGHRKNGGGIYTMTARPISEIKPYIRMIHVSNHLDYYITANTVSGVNRRESGLFGLQNIVIDIDCHDDSISRSIPELVQSFIWRIKRDLWDTNTIPTPNSIVRSGRGVQLWWALVPCYGGSDYANSRYHYDKIKNNFMDHIEGLLSEYSEELNGLEVDRGASSNPVGYFRLPCTYNTKAKKYSSLEILHSKRYDQRELTLLDAPEKPIYENDATHNIIPLLPSDIHVLTQFHSTGAKRVIQLINLRNLRKNDVGAETRNNFNFSVYNALRMSYDHEEAMARLRSYNAGFNQPMSDDELENCVVTAKKVGGYKYTNEKLIEFLGVSQEEQHAIGLYPFEGKYMPGQYSKPNASRDAVRSVLKEDRDNKIVGLVNSGISQAEVARQLNIGKNTVGRVMKKHREQMAVEVSEILTPEECHHSGSIYVLSTTSEGFQVAPSEGVFAMQSDTVGVEWRKAKTGQQVTGSRKRGIVLLTQEVHT